jgi:hypothetical protein
MSKSSFSSGVKSILVSICLGEIGMSVEDVKDFNRIEFSLFVFIVWWKLSLTKWNPMQEDNRLLIEITRIVQAKYADSKMSNVIKETT